MAFDIFLVEAERVVPAEWSAWEGTRQAWLRAVEQACLCSSSDFDRLNADAKHLRAKTDQLEAHARAAFMKAEVTMDHPAQPTPELENQFQDWCAHVAVELRRIGLASRLLEERYHWFEAQFNAGSTPEAAALDCKPKPEPDDSPSP